MQNTHLSQQISSLHGSLQDIVATMNRPQRDEQLLAAAGLSLERALFPLLVSIGKRGPIGVVDMADCVGRDYTTVSRQVARLEELGLVKRRLNAQDRRVREAIITDQGRAITDRIDDAREQMALKIFSDWDSAELEQFVGLIRRFADAIITV